MTKGVDMTKRKRPPKADAFRGLRVADSRGSKSATAPASLVLASTSPQRRAILEQLRIPFEVVPPVYEEHDPPDADPVTLVLDHAEGKARSVHVDDRVTLGVDTTVQLEGEVLGKAADATDAERMLRRLSGATHAVLSGVSLLGPGFAAREYAVTDVSFRALTPEAIEAYVWSGEWQGRAGAYAIQGLGGRLVAGIRGDYLNVVGLPGALLVELLERHAPALLAGG
jgi:nucleoside triphosphate pyrophosphatase